MRIRTKHPFISTATIALLSAIVPVSTASADTAKNVFLFISDGASWATWAMMIAGFGMVGFVARRRRALAAA